MKDTLPQIFYCSYNAMPFVPGDVPFKKHRFILTRGKIMEGEIKFPIALTTQHKVESSLSSETVGPTYLLPLVLITVLCTAVTPVSSTL